MMIEVQHAVATPTVGGGFIETPVGGPPPPPDLRATTPTIVSGVFERVAFLECPGASLQN